MSEKNSVGRGGRYDAVKDKFKNGDWVFGIGDHKGCSAAFDMDTDMPKPFSYLDDADPDNFRLATPEEIAEAGYSV